MTGEIVNLRRARKAQARDLRAAEAADNRVKHGTPKALRSAADAERRRADRALDQRKIEGAPSATDGDD